MKRLLGVISILMISMQFLSAQEVVENEVDEFTGVRKAKTSWEKIEYDGKGQMSYIRFSKYNDKIFLEFRHMGNSFFSISKGNELLFKLANNEVITLENYEYEITSRGGGSISLVGSDSYGIHARFPITKSQMKLLLSSDVEKYRLYTNDGYIDGNIKPKRSAKIHNSINLFEL